MTFVYFTLLISVTLKEINIYPNFNTRINLIPFSDIFEYLSIRNNPQFIARSNSILYNLLKNYVGNFLLFIPLGFLMSFKMRNTLQGALILGSSTSLLIELLQLTSFFKPSVFDTSDLILNTLGAIAGFILYKIFLSSIASFKVN